MPSGNQTWLAGISFIYWFFSHSTLHFCWGIFQPHLITSLPTNPIQKRHRNTRFSSWIVTVFDKKNQGTKCHKFPHSTWPIVDDFGGDISDFFLAEIPKNWYSPWVATGRDLDEFFLRSLPSSLNLVTARTDDFQIHESISPHNNPIKPPLIRPHKHNWFCLATVQNQSMFHPCHNRIHHCHSFTLLLDVYLPVLPSKKDHPFSRPDHPSENRHPESYWLVNRLIPKPVRDHQCIALFFVYYKQSLRGWSWKFVLPFPSMSSFSFAVFAMAIYLPSVVC